MSNLELNAQNDGTTAVSVSSATGSDKVTVRVIDSYGMISAPRSVNLGGSIEILFSANPAQDGQTYKFTFTKMNGSEFKVQTTDLGGGRILVKPLEAGSMNINGSTEVLGFELDGFADMTIGTTPEDVEPAIVPNSSGEFIQVNGNVAKTVSFDIQPSNYYNLEMGFSLGEGASSVFSARRVPYSRIPTFLVTASAVGTDFLKVWPVGKEDSSLQIPLNSVIQEFGVTGLEKPINKGESVVVKLKPSPENDDFSVDVVDFSYPPCLEITANPSVPGEFTVKNLVHFPSALVAQGSVGSFLNLSTYHWVEVPSTSTTKFVKKPSPVTKARLGTDVDMSVTCDKPMKYLEVYFMGTLAKVCHVEEGATKFDWTFRVNKEDQFGNYSFVLYEDKTLAKYTTAYTTIRPV